MRRTCSWIVASDTCEAANAAFTAGALYTVPGQMSRSRPLFSELTVFLAAP